MCVRWRLPAVRLPTACSDDSERVRVCGNSEKKKRERKNIAEEGVGPSPRQFARALPLFAAAPAWAQPY